MSVIANVIRPFWLKGLNDINGRVTKSLGEWFLESDYQIYVPIQEKTFTLNSSNHEKILSAFAFDCSRMAMSSFESITAISKHGGFPKSIAWPVIQAYYATFFAAHSILRMLGTSCTQISAEHAKAIGRVAVVFGQSNGVKIAGGLYACVYDSKTKTLNCTNIQAGSGGVHENFWKIFNDEITGLNKRILGLPVADTVKQSVLLKFAELQSSMRQGSKKNGSWLSFVRNEVNYRHGLGTWYPYKDYKPYYNQFVTNYAKWNHDPMDIDVSLSASKELENFQNISLFIVSLCRVLSEDMETRCSTGTSFHYYKSLAVLKLLEA